MEAKGLQIFLGVEEIMNENFRDFDAFFSEMDDKSSVSVKLYDKLYYLPSSIPASTLLQTYRASKDGNSTLSDAKQMEIAIKMLGEDNVEEWCSKGMTMDQLAEVMKWAAQQSIRDSSGKGGSGKK